MDLVLPGEGLLFWTTLVFVILLVLLKKFAWKPILGAVHTREGNIQKALDSAKDAEEKNVSSNCKERRFIKIS
jgi:F-type H+-transporting ATPase subunit b